MMKVAKFVSWAHILMKILLLERKKRKQNVCLDEQYGCLTTDTCAFISLVVDTVKPIYIVSAHKENSVICSERLFLQ